MRPIDADKLKVDRMTNKGLAISMSQIANAETLEVIPTSKIEEAITKIERKMNSGQWSEATVYGMQKAVAIILKHINGGKEE